MMRFSFRQAAPEAMPGHAGADGMKKTSSNYNLVI